MWEWFQEQSNQVCVFPPYSQVPFLPPFWEDHRTVGLRGCCFGGLHPATHTCEGLQASTGCLPAPHLGEWAAKLKDLLDVAMCVILQTERTLSFICTPVALIMPVLPKFSLTQRQILLPTHRWWSFFFLLLKIVKFVLACKPLTQIFLQSPWTF